MGVVDRRDDEHRARRAVRARPTGMMVTSGIEVFRDAHVGSAVGGRPKRGRAQAVRGRLGLVGRCGLGERVAEVGVLRHIDGQGDPGLVEQRDVDRVDGALDALEPVAGDPGHAPVAVQVLVGEGRSGNGWRIAAAEPHPGEAAGLVHGEVDDGHARREPLGRGPPGSGTRRRSPRRRSSTRGRCSAGRCPRCGRAAATSGGGGRARRGSRCGRPRRGRRRSSRRGAAPASARRRARDAPTSRTGSSSCRA